MQKYWLIAMPKENFDITLKKNIIGMASTRKKNIDKIEKGDLITFYITRERIDKESQNLRYITTSAEVTSDTFISDEEIWKAKLGDIFPYRKEVKFLKNKGKLNIRDILEELSFIKESENLKSWGIFFQRGPIELTKEDWELIQRNLN